MRRKEGLLALIEKKTIVKYQPSYQPPDVTKINHCEVLQKSMVCNESNILQNSGDISINRVSPCTVDNDCKKNKEPADDKELYPIAGKQWSVIFKHIMTKSDLKIIESLEPDECLEALCYNTDIYHYIHEKYKSDLTMCYFALAINGLLMRTINDSIKCDYLACLIAIQSNAEAYKYIDDSLKKDHQLCIEAVSRDGLMIKYADFSLRNDESIAKIALSNNGMALINTSPAIQCNKDLVLIAVSNYGYSLQWCSEVLRADPDVCTVAYNQSPGAAKFALIFIVPRPEPVLYDDIVSHIKTNYKKYQNNHKFDDIIYELDECPIIING